MLVSSVAIQAAYYCDRRLSVRASSQQQRPWGRNSPALTCTRRFLLAVLGDRIVCKRQQSRDLVALRICALTQTHSSDQEQSTPFVEGSYKGPSRPAKAATEILAGQLQ